jgi:hypothetical protein
MARSIHPEIVNPEVTRRIDTSLLTGAVAAPDCALTVIGCPAEMFSEGDVPLKGSLWE